MQTNFMNDSGMRLLKWCIMMIAVVVMVLLLLLFALLSDLFAPRCELLGLSSVGSMYGSKSSSPTLIACN